MCDCIIKIEFVDKITFFVFFSFIGSYFQYHPKRALRLFYNNFEIKIRDKMFFIHFSVYLRDKLIATTNEHI